MTFPKTQRETCHPHFFQEEGNEFLLLARYEQKFLPFFLTYGSDKVAAVNRKMDPVVDRDIF